MKAKDQPMLALLELRSERWGSDSDVLSDFFRRRFPAGPIVFDDLVPAEFEASDNILAFSFSVTSYEEAEQLVRVLKDEGMLDDARVTLFEGGHSRRVHPVKRS